MKFKGKDEIENAKPKVVIWYTLKQYVYVSGHINGIHIPLLVYVSLNTHLHSSSRLKSCPVRSLQHAHAHAHKPKYLWVVQPLLSNIMFHEVRFDTFIHSFVGFFHYILFSSVSFLLRRLKKKAFWDKSAPVQPPSTQNLLIKLVQTCSLQRF